MWGLFIAVVLSQNWKVSREVIQASRLNRSNLSPIPDAADTIGPHPRPLSNPDQG
jgi:hypothetical protein